MKTTLLVTLIVTVLTSLLLVAAEPLQQEPEEHKPVMCHYDMATQGEGGCSCAGQKHENCGVDPDTGRLMRDTRMCKAYCDMSLCKCCVS